MSNWDSTSKVEQAQGIVSVQADCTFDEALRMMIDRGQVWDQNLSRIADDVVAHRIWFNK